jgi:hypothetical protein
MTAQSIIATGRLGRAVRRVRASVLAACVLSASSVLPAQSASAPTGTTAGAAAAATDPSTIWFQVALGGATARLVCDICQSDRDLGPAVTVALGAYSSEKLRIGLEAGRWTYDAPAVRENLHSFGLVAHFAPGGWQRLYWLAGAGWTGYRAGDFSYDAPRLTVGLGWDLPLTGQWVVGNSIAVDAASFAPLRNGSVTVVRNVGLNALRVTTQLRRR